MLVFDLPEAGLHEFFNVCGLCVLSWPNFVDFVRFVEGSICC